MSEPPSSCPNCGHVRRDPEQAPAWQCPACSFSYPQAAAPVSAVPAGTGAHPAGNPRPGRRPWVFLVAAALLGLFLVVQPFGRSGVEPLPPLAAGAEYPRVVLFATEWCAYCARARRFFQRHGVPFVEYDVERDAESARTFQRLGGRGVPLILVGDRIVHGFDEGQLTRLLRGPVN